MPTYSKAMIEAFQHRRLTKAAQELIGICEGIVSDGEINDKEAAFLHTWLREHVHVTTTWPGNLLSKRIAAALADGIITPEEREHLVLTLREVTACDFVETGAAAPSGPALVTNDGCPVSFNFKLFCFTGKFLYGTRAACERAVLKLNAMAIDSVSRKLDYLVVGSMISEDWVATSYGRKIQQAMNLRQSGEKVEVISERCWTNALPM